MLYIVTISKTFFNNGLLLKLMSYNIVYCSTIEYEIKRNDFDIQELFQMKELGL